MEFKKLLLIIIALMLIPAMLAGIYLIRSSKPQTIESKADVAFRVSFSPRVLTGITKDSEFSIDLILNTQGKLISAVDVELKYPDNLRLIEFKPDIPGSGLEKAVIAGIPDNFSNTLRYVAVNIAGNLPVRGTIRLGQLKFKAVKDGLSKVEFTKAIITIPGDDQVIEPTLDIAEYSVGSTPSPSPSPSPSASPSTSPSPSPSSPPTCINGAVKGNRCVSNVDFVEWFKEWSGLSNTKNADFFPQCRIDGTRGDGVIDIADFEVWRRESGGVNKCN